jgi:hypothetical protein
MARDIRQKKHRISLQLFIWFWRVDQSRTEFLFFWREFLQNRALNHTGNFLGI